MPVLVGFSDSAEEYSPQKSVGSPLNEQELVAGREEHPTRKFLRTKTYERYYDTAPDEEESDTSLSSTSLPCLLFASLSLLIVHLVAPDAVALLGDFALQAFGFAWSVLTSLRAAAMPMGSGTGLTPATAAAQVLPVTVPVTGVGDHGAA